MWQCIPHQANVSTSSPSTSTSSPSTIYVYVKTIKGHMVFHVLKSYSVTTWSQEFNVHLGWRLLVQIPPEVQDFILMNPPAINPLLSVESNFKKLSAVGNHNSKPGGHCLGQVLGKINHRYWCICLECILTAKPSLSVIMGGEASMGMTAMKPFLNRRT